MSFVGRLRPYLSRDVCVLFFLGIASGLPILLVFGTLSVWLREAGVERATIGFLSWAALSYGFKFIWAPLLDSLPIPWLTHKLGRRRSWMLLSQGLVVGALILMATTDPSLSQTQFLTMAIGAVLLAFASATQDIVIDAYRIDIAPNEYQALLAGTAVAGYRVGMLFAGAGALELSSVFGSADEYSAGGWQLAYGVMALIMVSAMVLTLSIREPKQFDQFYESKRPYGHLLIVLHFLLMAVVFVVIFKLFPIVVPYTDSTGVGAGLIVFAYEALRLLLALIGAIVMGRCLTRLGLVNHADFQRIYIDPFADFFSHYGRLALWLILVICFYRVADIVMGVMAKVFYTDMGYSKEAIGRISFGFGLIVSLAGGILGGVMALRWGVLRMLLVGAILAAASNLVFVLLASLPEPSLTALTAAIIADNLAGGLATAVGVAFLSSLVNRRFGATQYAAFTSITLLLPKLMGGYAGQIVDAIDYPAFFMLTAAMGIPVVILILKIWRPYQQLQASLALKSEQQ